MANKKLKVELEVDAAKAKQKLRRDLSTVESGSAGDAGVDNASRSIKKLGDAANETQINMAKVSKAFIGMGLGLATSYASSHLEEGSTARTTLGYLGSALQYGSMGAMFMPGPYKLVGAGIGGSVGLAKEYFDRDAEQTAKTEEFEKSEKIFAETQAFREKLKELTKAADPEPVKQALTQLKQAEEAYADEVRKHLANHEYGKADDAKRKLAETRSQKSSVESLLEHLEGRIKEGRTSTDGTDAISRIGGGFTLGTDVNIQREMKMGIMDCAAYLKELTQKKEGSTWQ